MKDTLRSMLGVARSQINLPKMSPEKLENTESRKK